MHHTVLVTGGNTGIGRAIAIACSTRGASVAFTYRKNRAAAEDVTRQVIAAGGRALPVAMDLADPGSIHAAIARIEEWENGIGVLVANAYDPGSWTPGVPTPFEQIPVIQWQHILRQPSTKFAKATHSDRYFRSSSPLLQIAVKRHLFLPSAADHIPPRCGVDSHAQYGSGQTKIWFPIEMVTGNWTGLCGDRVVNGEEPAG